MESRDQPAAGAAPLAGGAVALGGAAAAVAYVGTEWGNSDSSEHGALFDSPMPEAQAASAAAPLTAVEASRFLAQATNGATRSEINYLTSNGINAWLNSQFARPRGTSHFEWLKARGANDPVGSTGKTVWANSVWRQLISGNDQLRQRVALGLLDIMVVGVDGLRRQFPQYAMAAYMDLLLDHAFGNFRNLLRAIATNSAMGQFLTFVDSRKADGKGIQPDENFARELMQLFTLGLYRLRADGSVVRDAAGRPVETYTQTDVEQLARVFTGLRLAPGALPEAHRKPLVIDPAANETGPSTFLGRTVSGGGMSAVHAALDAIFWHPNMAPFIARALIQRLVTSNPSPTYIWRVASQFINNGSGVRGDMRAVIRAILTAPEARGRATLTSPQSGKLRDPVQRFTNWARAFGATTSKNGRWEIGNTSGVARLNQSPGFSPSVFNFFRPGFSPSNSQLQSRGLVAPELQLAEEQSIVGYLNFMSVAINAGVARGDIMPNYQALLPLAPEPRKLLAEVNLLLAAGQLSPAVLNTMEAALNAIPIFYTEGLHRRIKCAVMMTMACPDYLVIQ